MLRNIFGFFFNRFTLVLLGLVLLSLVIWYVGPLIAIDRYRPLESETVRWIIIGTLFGLWVLKLLLHWWRAKSMNSRMMGHLVRLTSGTGKPAEAGPGDEEVAELEGRFKEAVSVLSKTRFGETESGLFGKLTKRYVYQLPWYLIIGSPGSGKTTALVNSGLNFPLAAQFGKGSIRGVGGTRNCDWWFTDQAVLLDTAGRYTTQESDAAQDKAAWQGFLQLLRRFRGRQPVNGVLVTLSVDELLSSTEQERDRLAQLIGLRLGELCEELSIKFPVYVLITKADLLLGFNEFFGNMNRDERAQVWGFTYPYNEQAKETGDPAERFLAEFDALSQQLNRLLPQRLLMEPDLGRRGMIYSLPQQVSGLRDVVNEMLTSIFASSRFKEKPILRGVYMTSGTQEGMPFDRVLSALSRRFNVGAQGRASLGGQNGKSYFIETLFKGVIFNEAGLTGRNAKKERQLRLVQAGGLIGLVAALVLATAAWIVSFDNNSAYLEEAKKKAAELAQLADEAKHADPENLVQLLPLIEAAETLAESRRYQGPSPPWSWRYGLLQRDKVQAAADATYLRLLEDAWVGRIARQLRRSLQETSTTNPEGSYEALKVYLMLHDPERFNGKLVKAWLLNEWSRTIPADQQQAGIIDKLAHHLDRLIDGRVIVSPIPMDKDLVTAVQQRLAQMSPAQRAYSRLKRLLLTSGELPPDFTLVRAVGEEAPQVFVRTSGKPLTQGISGLFTYNGYYNVFSREVPKVTTTLATEESWVLGLAESKKGSAEEALTGKLANEVKRLYLMEYAKLWEDFLAEVKPVRMASLEQAGEQARIYSAANSPLEMFVRAVAKETTLAARQESSSSSSWIGEKFNRVKEEQNQLQRLTGKEVNVAGLSGTGNMEADIVDFRFREYRRLAGVGSGGTGPAPIMASLQVMGEASAMISSAKQAVKAGGGTPPTLAASLDKVRTEAKRLPPPFNAMFEALATTASAGVGREVRDSVGANLNAAIGDFCRRAILGRYPFTRSATRDVTTDDFARLFSVGGQMDEFFRNTLAPMVDISTTPWSFRAGVDGTPLGGSASLAAFQRAAAIRDVFFRSGGRVPAVKLDIKPVEMDAAITQMVLDVDGQTLRYQHGPQIPASINWPGSRGTGQVRLQITAAGTGVSGLVTEGPWALHRFFDRAQLLPGNAPEKFTAVFNLDGRKLRFEVTTSSVLNPFRLKAMEEFECPDRL